MAKHSSQRDRDCAFLAREALFPLPISRDGSHPAAFPALEALQKARQKIMEDNAVRGASSFFPRRVVVVQTIGYGMLSWNGQPDLQQPTASFEVIPGILSVKCQECSEMVKAYTRQLSDSQEKEIVLCSNRLLGEYDGNRGKSKKLWGSVKSDDGGTVPIHSSAVIEEALAREITLHLPPTATATATTSTRSSNDDAVEAEILAARAAECYTNGTSRKGSQMHWWQQQDQCIRSVVSRVVGDRKAVDAALKRVTSRSSSSTQ